MKYVATFAAILILGTASAIDRNYGKIVNGRIVYAPDTQLVGKVTRSKHKLTEAERNAAGWLKIAITPPQSIEGKYVSATRYEVRDGRIIAVYEYADIPAETEAAE